MYYTGSTMRHCWNVKLPCSGGVAKVARKHLYEPLSSNRPLRERTAVTTTCRRNTAQPIKSAIYIYIFLQCRWQKHNKYAKRSHAGYTTCGGIIITCNMPPYEAAQRTYIYTYS